MQQIDNRRFMYNPKTGILVLGYQYAATSTMVSSHANELADAGITKGYDAFVRGCFMCLLRWNREIRIKKQRFEIFV